MDRKTVAKRLAEANIAPHSVRDGYPVYPFREAAEACLDTAGSRVDENGQDDPRLLPPDKRKAWYQSEESRLSVEQKTRRLIPAAEFEAEQAELVKTLVQFLTTLPDVLERDSTLSPEQVERLHELVATQREVLYQRIVAGEDREPVEAAG